MGRDLQYCRHGSRHTFVGLVGGSFRTSASVDLCHQRFCCRITGLWSRQFLGYADFFPGITGRFRSTLSAGVPGHCPVYIPKAYVREGNGLLWNGGHHRADYWSCRGWLSE